MFPVARCKSYRTYFQLHHMYKAEANWPIANNCCSTGWKWLSTHGQFSYIGNCNICIEGMISWQKHHSSVRSKIQFSVLCILRKCGAVGWILRAGWTWGGSGCDTVHILSRAVGKAVNYQCCHSNNEWHGLSHHVLGWLQKSKALFISQFGSCTCPSKPEFNALYKLHYFYYVTCSLW